MKKKSKPILIIEKETLKDNLLDSIFVEFNKVNSGRIYTDELRGEPGPQGHQGYQGVENAHKHNYNKELEEAIKYSEYGCGKECYEPGGHMNKPIDYSEYIKENQDMKKDKKVTAKELKDNSKKVERLVEDTKENNPVVEVYTFKVTKEYDGEELIMDTPSQPLQPSANPFHHIKQTWKIPIDKDEITMEVNLEHHSTDDSNILPEYKELIAEMWKAKHRNEIICNEIVEKHNKLEKELKKKKKKNH
jgi:hypothetical protein